MKTISVGTSHDLKKLNGKGYSAWHTAKLSARLLRDASNLSKLLKLMADRTVYLKYEKLNTLIKLNLKHHHILSEKCQRASLELLNQSNIFYGLTSQEALAAFMHMSRTLAKLKIIVDNGHLKASRDIL